MMFKLDENLGQSAAELLKSAGHDVETVHEEKLCGKPDEMIYKTCIKEHRCLISFDLDFSNILRFPPYKTAGIIILRPRKYSNYPQIHKMLRNILDVCTASNPAKSLWVVETNSIRIHTHDMK